MKKDAEELLDIFFGTKKTKKKDSKLKKEEKDHLMNLSKEGLTRGKELERQGRYADAIKEYTKMIELFKKNKLEIDDWYYFRRAYSNYELGNYDQSLEDYKLYIKKHPKYHIAHNNIALIYCTKGDHKKEFEHLDRCLKQEPKYALAYRNKCVCYRDRKMYKKALKEINKAVEFDPNNSYNHSMNGEILEYLGKKEEALSSFESAIDLDPNNKYANTRLNSLKKGDKELMDFNFNVPPRTFKDVAGLNQIKKWAKSNILAPFKNPELAKKYNRKFGGGILMYGPPGCGKTYFTSALAGEGKIKMIKIKISSIMNMWVGNSEKNVEKLFRNARKNKPCIIFIDEIDGLGSKRGVSAGSYYGDKVVNQFLMEISELEENEEEILVIGATNAPWKVDDALKRSGRFGKFMYIGEPDEESRIALFKMYSKKIPTDKKIDFKKLAKLSKYFSAADIKSVCEHAAGVAFEKASESENLVLVDQAMLEEGIRQERSDILEWYNTATRMTNLEEMKEFYPELYKDIKKIVKEKKWGDVDSKMFG